MGLFSALRGERDHSNLNDRESSSRFTSAVTIAPRVKSEFFNKKTAQLEVLSSSSEECGSNCLSVSTPSAMNV
jgi:hypothetical protein